MMSVYDILESVVPPRLSYSISLENGHTRASLDMAMNKYKMGYLHDQATGTAGVNQMKVSRMFDLVTYISCDEDIRDVHLVIENGEDRMEDPLRIKIADHVKPYQYLRICGESSFPRCGPYGTAIIEYLSESDHTFFIHGLVLGRNEMRMVTSAMLTLSIGHKMVTISDGIAKVLD
jgi:hypothetical protein